MDAAALSRHLSAGMLLAVTAAGMVLLNLQVDRRTDPPSRIDWRHHAPFGDLAHQAPAPVAMMHRLQPSPTLPAARLLGIYGSAERAFAIIAGPEGEVVYRVGDRVGEATITAIHSGGVVLAQGNAQASLALDDEGAPRANAPHTPASVEPASKLMQRAQQLSTVVSVEPLWDGLHLRGVRLRPGQNPMMFHALGLREGDIVTAIDGAPLTALPQAERLLQAQDAALPAELTLERAGKLLTLALPR